MTYKTIISNLKDKTHLSLNNKNIREEDVKSLAEALKYSQVTTLDLSNANLG
jgi:hypothetical protein